MPDLPTEQQREALVEAYRRQALQLNLSAFRTEEAIRERHLEDSLQIADLYELHPQKILDLGTGGGFPGLAMSLLWPDSRVTLLDSVQKKLSAIEAMIEEVNIENAQTVHGRAEELAHEERHRGAYDLLVTRACAPWPVLLELAVGFIQVGGKMCTWRSGIENEAEDRALLEAHGLRLLRTYEYALSDGRERELWLMEKKKETPSGVPREVGMPKKYPWLTSGEVGKV